MYDASRKPHLLVPKQQPQRFPTVRIGVALSGGGYRATLVQAGILSALDDLHIRPSGIAAVSGGSIAAAFYALGGAPNDLLAAIQDHRLNLERDLLWIQNAIRLPFPGRIPWTSLDLLPWMSCSRTDVQAALLDRVLFGGKRMCDLPDAPSPQLLICATDELGGKLVGLCARGVIVANTLTPSEFNRPNYDDLPIERLFQDLPRVGYWPASLESSQFPTLESVADMVAASGAFPGAFEPISRKTSNSSKRPGRPDTKFEYRLIDGGITDNTGLMVMLASDARSTYEYVGDDLDAVRSMKETWNMDIILSSDAGSVLGSKAESEVGSDILRALDIIYARVLPVGSELTRNPYEPRLRPDVVSMSLWTFDPSLLANADPVFRVTRAPKTATKEADINAVRAGLREKAKIFLKTKTLDDHISADDARQLYDYGRDMVRVNLERIEDVVRTRKYRMALAAAIAATDVSGPWKDSDSESREKWRGDALTWLREALEDVVAVVHDNARLAEELRRWQAEPSLAKFRNASSLDSMAASERSEWEALWNDVGQKISGAEVESEAK
jgi:predicted acylesterase/phospholipase RssA